MVVETRAPRRRGLEITHIGSYLIYAAVTLRAVFWYGGMIPDQRGRTPALLYLYLPQLIVFGLLLVSEPWLTPRLYPARGRLRAWYPILYLLVQTGLIISLESIPPHPDFIPLLLAPLSIRAVLWFGWRTGFVWNSGFSFLTAALLLLDWPMLRVAHRVAVDREIWSQRLGAVILFSALWFLFGSYAHRVRQAQAARGESERLLGELQLVYGQLQDYAAQVEALGVAEERGHLARDLHDSVTQTLFSMNLTVQSIRALRDKDTARAAAQLDRLQDLAQGALAEIQQLVSELRPRSPTQEGLVAALRRHIATRQAQDGLQVELIVNGPERRDLPAPVVVGLYRIVQEALNNIVKHAETKEAVIRLDLTAEPISVEVQDRGVGFAATVALSAGKMGLAGMAARAREIGWRLTVESQPGRGTRIRAEGPGQEEKSE